MLIQEIALVTETSAVSLGALMRASAALQKQSMRDFVPVWEVQGTVDPFEKLEDVPLGYWPVIIRDDIGFPGAAGIHLDKDGQPFALVQHSANWALTCSHEILEMLADPFGNRLVAGNSIKPGQGRVEYLVEVCDPSEAEEFGYTVNGILLSDFYTPKYFDPVGADGVRYSFTGSIPGPRQVLKGGYLSWHDPVSDHWFQQTFFGTKKTFRDLGVFSGEMESLRSEIDRRTFQEPKRPARGARAKLLAAASAPPEAVAAPTSAKAESWHQQIAALKAKYKP
jgi:hypothetical protein